MKTFKLEGQPRKDVGKKSVKALRKQGLIPAVLYGNSPVELPYNGELEEGQILVENQGKGIIITNFTVTFDAVRKLVYTPEIFLVELTINGKVHNAILKDLQFHPVTDEILHMDFLTVFPDKPIVVEVPVITEGFAVGVKAGGKLNIVSRKLKVKALSKDIPEKLLVDITKLEIGKTIQVKHLDFENLTLLNAPDNVVCAVVVTRSAKSDASLLGEEGEEEGGEETEEGAEENKEGEKTE